MKMLKDEIRERILDTAKAFFLEKGYALHTNCGL